MALDMSAVKKKQTDLQNSGGSGADFDKLESGNNVRRVLPPKGDKQVFWSEGFLHFSLGDDGKTTVTCLETFGDEPCPICAYVEELKKSKNKEDKKLADDIKKTKRTYIAVLNREADEEKPVILSVGKTIMKSIIDLICDPDYGDITDFEEGIDITIKKIGSGMKTDYTVTPKRNSSRASEEMTEEELQELLPELDTLFVRKSAEELQAILDGEDYEADEEEDEEEEDVNEDYDDLSLDDLIEYCEERGIKMPPRVTRLKLITLLTAADEAEEYEEKASKKAASSTKTKSTQSSKSQKDEDNEADEEKEQLQADLEAALKRRKSKK